MNLYNVRLIGNIESVITFLLMLISTGPKTVYRPVVPVYTRFLNRSISATQFVSRNREGHMETVQPITCILFILIFNYIPLTYKYLFIPIAIFQQHGRIQSYSNIFT